jgi:SOS-response transcriptional repressor LexA
MTVGRRIKAYREERGWSQSDLAREMSRVKGKTLSRESVSQWEAGNYPGPDNVLALAQAFDKPEWEFQRFTGDTARLSTEAGRHSIPLLRWCNLKHIGTDGMVKHAALRNLKQIDVDKDVPEHAYGIVITDVSMSDRFMPGEEVIIDPKLKPRDNPADPDFVLARVDKTSQFVFREYRQRGPEAFDLVGYHRDCKTISSTPADSVTVLGVMVEHRRKRR